MCVAQGPQSSDPSKLETAAFRSRVKHSTSEPLHSLNQIARHIPLFNLNLVPYTLDSEEELLMAFFKKK